MNRTALWLFIAFLSIGFEIRLQSQDHVTIRRLSSSVIFDGIPYEEAWSNLEYFQLTMYRPNSGAQPSERSEVMIGYDDKFLWIGARLFMQDASQILSSSHLRDEESRNSDSFGVILDTYNDNETAMAFFTMPSGLRTDYLISNDAVNTSGLGRGSPAAPRGGRATIELSSENYSWNTFWDVLTSQDDKGWYVEMRIPLSSLRFKPQGDSAVMGLIINRTISLKSEIDTYPEIDPRYGLTAIRKPSLARKIVFNELKPSKPLYIAPYVIGGFSRDWALNSQETAYEKTDNPEYNAGLDIKYNLSSNLILDLTANTDFAQVEADDQQLNLTRYSLFFPEKRTFFQERSSLFSFSLGESADIFYSRNIGISEEGEPIRIYGGARLVGRLGRWDVGLLDMQTEKHGETPAENFGVLRMRRQVINPYSHVGGIFTSKVGMNGSRNFAYGLDGIFRLFHDDYLDVKLAQTYDDVIDNKIGSIDPAYISVKWERRTDEGFAYALGYSYAGQEFDPGIGFVPQGSMQRVYGNLLYGWIPGPESRFFSYVGNIQFSRYSRLEDGKLESMSVKPAWSFYTKKGYICVISLEYQQEGVLNDFSITDSVGVEAGNYKFLGTGLHISSPRTRPFYVRTIVNAGEFYDGQRYSLMIIPSYNVNSKLQISASYQVSHLRFPSRNQKANIHLILGRLLYMFNTKLSASVFVQYSNISDGLIGNFRFRYNPREGNDLYLVYNEYRGVGNDEQVPALPSYFNRTIMVKYTHTFRLGR